MLAHLRQGHLEQLVAVRLTNTAGNFDGGAVQGQGSLFPLSLLHSLDEAHILVTGSSKRSKNRMLGETTQEERDLHLALGFDDPTH